MAVQFSFKSGDGTIQRFNADFSKFEVTANFLLTISLQGKNYTSTGNFFSASDKVSSLYQNVPYSFNLLPRFHPTSATTIGLTIPQFQELIQGNWNPGNHDIHLISYFSSVMTALLPNNVDPTNHTNAITLADGTKLGFVQNPDGIFLITQDPSLFFAVNQSGKPVLYPVNYNNTPQCALSCAGSAIFRGTAQSATFICQIMDISAIKQNNPISAGLLYTVFDFTNGGTGGIKWNNQYVENMQNYPTPPF